MTLCSFDETAWIQHLACALERLAADETSLVFSTPDAHSGIGLYPAEAIAILREHPLLKPGLRGSGWDERLLVRILNSFSAIFLRKLVVNLAKLSIKKGGTEAAHRLHCFLTAGANGTIPAHEVTVIHGLVLETQIELDAGAFLAPYADAREKFNLPPYPEPFFSDTSFPEAAVLVRGVEFGPSSVPSGSYEDRPEVEAAYRFPADYRIQYKDWFADSSLLVDLLSIATEVPLLSHTRYVKLADWIGEMDPNLGSGTYATGGYWPDAWRKGHDPTKDEIEVFLKLASYVHTNEENLNTLQLAARRLGSSLSRPWGRFGQEDRILDVAIALEMMYELDGSEITYKLKTRAGHFLGQDTKDRMEIIKKVDSFYDVRSNIVHGSKKKGRKNSPEDALADGFSLARKTLLKLSREGWPSDWNLVVMSAGHGED